MYPQNAPINKSFEDYTKPVVSLLSRSINNLGVLPEDIDFSHYTLRTNEEISIKETYPTTYDLRDHNAVTPVRDQNPYGTCWTFGTVASQEGIMKRFYSKNEDYSEKHIVNKSGWIGINENTGGWSKIVAAYAFAWRGLVYEVDDPYPIGSWTTSPDGISRKASMKEFRYLPIKQSATDLDEVKKHLTDYGPVTVSTLWDSSYYNSTHYSFYGDGSASNPGGHCVCCIGWDDNFSRTNFNIDPGIDGAFLVKNSWNSTWGDQGYFWMSYADAAAGSSSYLFNISIPNESLLYTDIYQHDLNGWTINKGYTESDSWMGKIFQTKENPDVLKAISFVTTTGNQNFEIFIYKDPNSNNPASGTMVYQASGSYIYAGYHTYELPSEIILNDCASFSIVIHLVYSDYSFMIACEQTRSSTELGTYVEVSPISLGQSFVSSSSSNWYDTYNAEDQFHVCIKALTALKQYSVKKTALIINNQKAPICENQEKTRIIKVEENI